jgi:hypothetical protein
MKTRENLIDITDADYVRAAEDRYEYDFGGREVSIQHPPVFRPHTDLPAGHVATGQWVQAWVFVTEHAALEAARERLNARGED